MRYTTIEQPPRTYSLYDPVTGFAYTYDLFEKELYRQSVSQNNNTENRHTANINRTGSSADRLMLP